MAFGRAPNRCVPRTQSGKAIGAPNGQRLACFGAVARAGARGVDHLDPGRNVGRADRDHGRRGRRQHHRPAHSRRGSTILAGFGAILLTFLAGTEIDAEGHPQELLVEHDIGVVGFFAPYLGVLLYARYVAGWPWPQAQIAGISLSTTSVAVVYAVMVETGFNKTEIGKIILAACFINDLGTVLALGIVFANYNLWLGAVRRRDGGRAVAAAAVRAVVLRKVGHRVSEPETKFIVLVLFSLGGLATSPAARRCCRPTWSAWRWRRRSMQDPELPHRMRIIAFAILTPFYFLKAGSLVDFQA